MLGSQELLLNVWREACKHIEIGEFAGTCVPLLAAHMPPGTVRVLQVDAGRQAVETLTATALGSLERPPPVHVSCDAEEMSGLGVWCRGEHIAHRGAPHVEAALERLFAAAGPAEEMLAVTLTRQNEAAAPGILLLTAAMGQRFGPEHARLAQALAAPFAAAMENDTRLTELAALREAAEADKQSLLSRLGRRQLTDTIVGADRGLKAVMERIALVARSDAPVLIFGETGSGKELIARTIHNRSPRSANAFIRVNCGAIPSELIDSELFGHERGAFTGAVRTRHGWFERAHSGTLFLDEIGDLPLAAQVRLLRILQDGGLERVGGQESVHVDVRIVAATHRDLAGMVAEGRFREDLWYRLAVFPVILPPLRERRGDIAGLARHFAERAATRFGLRRAMPTAAHIDQLRTYPWPGNVRELAAVIDRAAILGDGEGLEVAKALGISTTPAFPHPMQERSPAAAPTMQDASIRPMDEVIRDHIEKALAATGGRIEGPHGCAVALGVNPNTLRARMRKLDIDRRRYARPHPGTEDEAVTTG